MPRTRQRGDIHRARDLRAKMTLPEVLLWRLLKQQDLAKIRRQHALGPYVLDFYCAEAKLCIEIDGLAHDMGERPERDAIRDHWLAGQGIAVLRLAASDVMGSPEDAASAILAHCLALNQRGIST